MKRFHVKRPATLGQAGQDAPAKPPRKPPNHIEHQHQVALIDWARRVRIPPASDIPAGAFIADFLLAIPNGGKRNAFEGARLKAEGVKPGVSDLLLPIRRGGFAGLWLEMKAPGEKPTPDQREWLERMTNAGYFATWADSWDKAATAISDYLDGAPMHPMPPLQSRKPATKGRKCSESSSN